MIDTPRRAIGYGLPVAWLLVLVALADRLGPIPRLLGATVVLLLSIKVGSWLVLRARGVEYSLSPVELLLFWTVWPGVRPDQFAGERDPRPDARTFVAGYVSAAVGVLLVLAAFLAVPVVGADWSSWLLLAGLLSLVHQGVGRLLPFGLRWLGFDVPPLFDDPLASRSVAEFWSERWNRPFVGMNRLLVTRPLAARFGVGVAALAGFTVSGVLHEVAISYPAGAGWGLPFLYFVVQGVAYTAEQRLPLDVAERPVLGRAWTWGVISLPVPLLFHAPFRATFLVPVVEAGRAILLARPLATYVEAGLWLGAAGHFLVLAASVQVPSQLDWDTDLASLEPLNRKLLWTYGGFIVLTILAFGVLTALFHEQLAAGTPVALGLCGFVATFWTARIVVDATYFSHDDWPDGIEFVVGHALLTTLFVVLVVIYAGTVVVHLA